MRKTLTFLIVLMIALGAAFDAVAQPYEGIVSVDSAQAHPAESFSVSIWLRNNSIDPSAMTIPLRFSSSALTLDSVSLEGTVWGGAFIAHSVIDNHNRTVQITILPDDMVYPLPSVSFVDGVVARMHFSVASDLTPHWATIDSIYTDTPVGGNVHVYTQIVVSDDTGSGYFLPDFVEGGIELLAPTGVDDDPFDGALPANYELAQNYPNPFNPSTIISFSLPRAGLVDLTVFNILGQQVARLVEGRREAGIHQIEFDGAGFPSGIYFYRLQHTDGSLTRKMSLVK